MSAQALVQRLVAWVQEETAIQGKLADALERIEQALRAGVREEVETAVNTLQLLIPGSAHSEARRRGILDACARTWGLGARPTLPQVIERAACEEAQVATLERMRVELRQRVTSVVDGARRLAVMVRHQRGILQELRGALTGQDLSRQDFYGQDSLDGRAAEGILA